MAIIKCFSCRAETDDFDGPTHRYLLSTPGCWARYGEVLAREYSDFAYMSVHGLTVDAYSVQHPGQPNPQTINSINVHLSSLYAYFVLGSSISNLAKIKAQLSQCKKEFTWLEPPHDLGTLTINDVWRAENSAQHCNLVKEWAEEVFLQWKEFYPVAKKLLEKIS